MSKKNKNFSIKDLDVTGLVKEKSGNILGNAHEHFVAAVMMRLGFEISLSEISASVYDCIIGVFSQPPNNSDNIGKMKKTFIKAQIKTAKDSIRLTGGGRAGVDRIYNTEDTDNKIYKYTSEMVDLIIGVDKKTLDLYILPTVFTKQWGKSKTLSKIQPVKNNWSILLNWNEKYLNKIKFELPDFK